MPSLGLMVSALLIKAFITWLNIDNKSIVLVDTEDTDTDTDTDKTTASSLAEDNEPKANDALDFIPVANFLILAHIFGSFAAYLPYVAPLDIVFHEYGIKTEVYIFFSLLIVSLVGLTLPIFFSISINNIEVRKIPTKHSFSIYYFKRSFVPFSFEQLLHVAVLLEVATALIIVGMLNFSLAFILGSFFVPFALFIDPKSGQLKHRYDSN